MHHIVQKQFFTINQQYKMQNYNKFLVDKHFYEITGKSGKSDFIRY